MRVVREVASQGSFSAAARELGYTQSAVSRQVAIAEQAVGAVLFDRLPRGVRLTAPGVLLHRHIESILQRLDSAMLELTQAGETLHAQIAIGAFPTALGALVPRSMARVQHEHPTVTFTVREGGSEAQLRRLRARRVDLAVIATGGGLQYDLDGLAAEPVLRGTALLAVAKTHPLADRGWINVADLANQPWLVGVADRSGPQFGPWPTLEADAEIAHSTRDWIARLGMVAAGLGVAIIPSLLLPALPPDVRAIRVEDPQAWHRDVLAVTHTERGPGVQALLSALHREAGELGPSTLRLTA